MTNDGITFEVDTAKVEKVFATMPKVAYIHLRAFFFGILLEHRLAWLKSKGKGFGRGKKAIKVLRVGQTAGEGPKTVVYDVEVDKKKASSSDEARRLLKGLSAQIRTGNVILPTHEFGKTVRAKGGRWLVIPIKRRSKSNPQGNIKEWQTKKPKARIVFKKNRKGGGLLGFSVTGKRKTKWDLRWVLKREVQNESTLGFYEQWDRLRADRDSKWRYRADRMLQDFERADPRDL